MARPKRKPSSVQQRAQAPATRPAREAAAVASSAQSTSETAASQSRENTQTPVKTNEAVGSAKTVQRERPKGHQPLPATRSRRRYVQRRSWVSNPWVIIGGSVAILLIIIGVFVYLANRPIVATIGPTDSVVLRQVTSVKPQVLSDVGGGTVQSNEISPVQPTKPLLKGPNGKPQFFYYGAEYCPICAGQRWAVVVALSHFGTFSQLPETASSGSDSNPNTATFTFKGSKYTSDTIDFVPVEAEDRDQQTLQNPTADQQTLLQQYKVTGFPFIDIADQFTISGGLVDSSVLQNMSQRDIASKLSDSNSDVAKNIVGAANYMTAAICAVTNNQPASACTQDPIPTLEHSFAPAAAFAVPGQTPVIASIPQAVAFRRRDDVVGA